MNKRLLLGFIIVAIAGFTAVDLVAQNQDVASDQEMVKIRTARPGRWDDPDIWERWNGSQWTPLLPNQYPGCRALRFATVQVEHKVMLPLGLDIHVTQVSAVNAEYLLVDGQLTTDIAKNENDPNVSDAPITGATSPDRASGITVAPNPLLMATGGGRVTVSFVVADEYLTPRLRLYDESGNVVRELKQWERLPAGSYNMGVVLSELPSGTYHLALEAPGVRRTQALTIVK